jgi:S-DNA-T family DNA segregation ATPase FtsK/SpoIIIE
MTMRWTVRRTLDPRPVEVLIDAPVGTRFEGLRAELLATAGAGPDDPVSVDGVDLGDAEVVGRGRLLDGAELVVRPPGPLGRPVASGPAVALVAVAGPDCARVHPLRRGGTVLGRHRSADAVIDDPDVSRRHLHVVLTPSGAEITDLGSTNGTAVRPPRPPGRPAPPARAAPVEGPGLPAPLGSQVVVGATRLEVRALPAGPGEPDGRGERGDGTVVHAVAAGRPPAGRDVVLRLPARPAARERRRMPWLTALVPLAVAVPLAVWWGSPAFLLLGIAGPVTMVAAVLADRRDTGRRAASDVQAHVHAVAEVRRRAAVATADAADLRHCAHPDLDLVLRSARHRDARLWDRAPEAPDALSVRVGTMDLPGPVRVEGDDQDGGDTGGDTVLAAVPLVVDVAGGLAVAGPREWATGIVRGVVGRLAVALPPNALRVTVCAAAPEAEGWSWARRLPHAEPPVRRPSDVPAGAAATGASRDAPVHHVVVVDGPDTTWVDAAADLARRPGVAPVVLVGGSVHGHGCSTVIAPAGETATELRATSPGWEAEGVADRVGAWWPERLSRALAPLRPALASGGLPDQVTLAELVSRTPGTSPPAAAAADVVARWDDPARDRDRLAVPLAVGPAGPVDVDLVRDGPHALIAGTTGAGKSELLRSLVLGLAWCHPPEEVTLLLVDFKGGAAFAEAARLPHTVGTVTDLDPHAARRVLASLRAELRRRERVLAAAGAADLRDLRRVTGSQGPARLVVVVDEFRVLADEAPDVLEGLVRVAVVGRSLGVHLVLATQRPAGVVSADIRANTSLRIALRVADPGESRDVVEVPDAAALPPDTPGRAVLSCGGRVGVVQAARASSPAARGRPTVRLLAPEDDAGRAGAGAGRGHVTDPADDVEGLVAACRRAVVETGRAPAVPPWLPPLPAEVGALAEVPGDGRDGLPGPALPFAVLDLPEEQRRAGFHWRPAGDGPLVVSGGPGSGRTTALASLAVAAAGAGLAVVVVTGDPRRDWPAGTVVVDRHDGDHVTDTLAALAARPGGGPTPWACLLVDDADALLRWAADRPGPADLLGSLLREAGAARLAVALAGGRDLLADRATAGGRARVLLRPADPADVALAGIPVRALPRAMPPGRCLVTGTDHGDVVEGQVARAAAAPGPVRATPAPVPPALPVRVQRPPAVTGSVTWPRLPLGPGLIGTVIREVTVDVSASPLLVVGGPPGSGRTTALRAVADGALAAGAAVVLLHEGDVPDEWAAQVAGGLRCLAAGEARGVMPDAGPDAAPAPLVVIVDDLDVAGPAVEEVVTAVAATTGPAGPVLVAAAATAWLAGSFRGPAAEARRRGTGLLLRPGRHDGRDVLGVAVPGQDSRLPGRGVLVRAGAVTRVQVTQVTERAPVAGTTEPAGGGPGLRGCGA